MKLFVRTTLNLEFKTALYYLVAQAGILIFFCANNSFRDNIPLLGYFNYLETPGPFNSTGGGNIAERTGIALICFGLVQLTRSFLNTSKTLPQLDVRLAFGLAGYLVFSLLLSLANTKFFYPDLNILVYEKFFLSLLIAVIFCTLISGYIQNLPAAGLFLVAVLLPILLVSARWWLPAFSGTTASNFLQAYPAIVCQALVFPIVLAARNQLIRNKMKMKNEARKFEFARWKAGFSYRVSELENN